MEIQTFGTGRRMDECLRLLSHFDKKCAYERLLLLPIPTSRDGVHVTGAELVLEELLADVGEGALVVGYGLPSEIAERAVVQGAEVYDAAEDEEFLVENAQITARGALAELLTLSDRDLTELSIGIVGYGRIGSELLRLLLFLGARVRVYSRRLATRLELSAMGASTAESPTVESIRDLDVLVNTAPAPLLTAEELVSLPERLIIVDLASGVNFPDSPKVKKLPSIPEKMYPLTAGGVYFRHIAAVLSGGEAR